MDSFEGLPNWLSNRGAGITSPKFIAWKIWNRVISKQARE